jgi:hypothetical protein
MIIDCARQMLYIHANDPSTAVSQSLASLLSGRGFSRIPMRWNSTNHLEVPAVINGHPTRLIVDTGAAVTTLDKRMASKAGVSISGTRFVEDAGEGRVEQLGTGDIKQLTIGDFTIPKASVGVVNVSGEMLHSKSEAESNSGLIGAEYLAWNFAVIDVGGMALYLRHPDFR